jgi:phage terminase small subunit
MSEEKALTTAETNTIKRQRFVEEYLVDFNATQAAIRAGYSPKTAYAQGCRLLKKADVRAAVAKGTQAKGERSGITQRRVLKELELLAFSDVSHYVVDDDGEIRLAEGAPEGAMRALQSVKRKVTARGAGDKLEVTREVELKLWNKPEPLKLAGRHVDTHGFSDKDDGARPLDAFGVLTALASVPRPALVSIARALLAADEARLITAEATVVG